MCFMIQKNNWYISIQSRNNQNKLSIYRDGSVYGTKRNEKLFILAPEALEEITNIIKPNLSLLRRERYLKDDNGKFIIRINDTSRKHPDCIKVIHPGYDRIFTIISNKKNQIELTKN